MKKLLLALVAATLVVACATTTSPTGRTQYVGAVPQDQLDQLGAQAFVEMKGKQRLSTDRSHTAYVTCVVQAVVRELPADHARSPGSRRCSPTTAPTPSRCRAAR